MSLYDAELSALDGTPGVLNAQKDRVTLLVNVASKCGLTPQYAGLEELYQELHGEGLAVLGFPCNQFGSQESGTEDEISEFCQVNYGVSFPLLSKIEVNDIHSALNSTEVEALRTPTSLGSVQAAIASARAAGNQVAVCGGRHAMGGQQFCSGGILLDTSRLDRVLDFDAERGTIERPVGGAPVPERVPRPHRGSGRARVRGARTA